tara:strand:+ start:605 stop:1129 length:525 start_codon:yes stop_codon:yes gene_type:complete
MSTTSQPISKAEEPSAESSQIPQEQDAPPTYTPDTSNPPTYDSLAAAVHVNMSSLSTGDPSETISVPMISRMHKKNIHDLNPFSRKTGKVTQTVTVRKMTREFYLKHYAKDGEGNFIGTASQAPDAALVFVPGKSTPEDLMRQVQEVAFGKQQVRGGGMGTLGTRIQGGGASGA